MMNPEVSNEQFWAKRLFQASKLDILHWSVYLANAKLWGQINVAHEEIFNKLIKDTDKVLDAGCGYGRWSGRFKNYVGVDFAPAFIEKAKELAPDKIFIQANLTDLPFKDKEFDWAFCISIRQMIQGYDSYEKWEAIEKELKRVAKKILILEYTDFTKYEIL